ncbi:hypothetical protein P389DRAFT_143 [Cystobasidium minutum MCA 4210]|uniref:uncharacterized protein n=1 Tax=Cystobasidium minutum MCA 4210 TaxID=1397322 RepID=UPI0034CFF265|eukprot:jgi/Rhomi1/143/CE142_2856
MTSHIPHPHSSHHKGQGYAFALNLIRSLGLWSPQAVFPNDVQKPSYLCLNPANNTIDWSEQLRKYNKHNSDHQSRLNAACAKLELIIWRSVEARTSKRKYLELQKRRLDRRRRLLKRASTAGTLTAANGSGNSSTQPQANAQASLPPPPDELIVRKHAAREEIKRAMHEVLGLLHIDEKGPAAKEARIILALASYSLEDYEQCLTTLPEDNGGFASKKNASSHDLDLQVLAITLRGMAHEQLSRRSSQPDREVERAVAAYTSLPITPPPPIPEGQRYVEMGLARLAFLESPGSPQACRQYLSLTSNFKSVSPGKQLLMYRMYLSSVMDQLQARTVRQSDSEDAEETGEPDTSQVFPTIQAYEQLLYSNSSLARFPKAGEPTINMYEYMDTLFAFWDLGIVPGRFAVESLYRALSKTYASQRLHRYLVIICSTLSFIESKREISKAHSLDAMRNLRLYIALFEKSRETDSQAVQAELNRYKREHGEISSSEDEENEEPAGVPSSSDKSQEYNPTERDEDFCRVACVGTRLLLTESRLDGKQEQEDDRLELIEEALHTIEKARKILEHEQSRDRAKDKISGQDSSERQPAGGNKAHSKNVSSERRAVNAEVHMWFGIARAEWALAEADPEQSRETSKNALADLQAAIDVLPPVPSPTSPMSPTSPISPALPILESRIPPRQASDTMRALRAGALYSLAYAQLEARDVRSAVATAKLAIDTVNTPAHPDEPTSHAFTLCDNLKIWHLFVLALTARKDLNRAVEVADLALYGDQEDIVTADDPSETPEAEGRPVQYSASRALSSEDAPWPASPGHQYTRADAPYDPSATGGVHSSEQDGQANGRSGSSSHANGEDSGSSYVNVRLPDGTSGSPAAGTSTSISRTRSPSIVASLQGSTAGKFREKRQEPMTLRTTSPWDDLEAEIDLMITKNKCIEAVEGPEIALQDLQMNVFTRFSKKRDDLERSLDNRPAEQVTTQLSRTRTSTGTTTYPYPASSMQDGARLAQQLQAFSARNDEAPQGRARSLLGSISGRRSRANTVSRAEPQTAATSSNHLAVPEVDGGRPASVQSSTAYSSVEVTLPRHTNGTATSAAPAKPLQPQASRILSRLWLTSAATFRRWGKMDECLGAINEAEDVAGDKDPEVWLQYALYLKFATNDNEDLQHLAMSKALAIFTDHVPTCLLISKTHLERGNWAIAEGFLDVATQTNAWDSPEAWYLLAKAYENTRRRQRAKDCLLYALELEKTRPIRELRVTLPRFI